MGYSHITWSCPYFRWDAKGVVKCEAGRITFPDRTAEREHTRKYCAHASGYHGCSLAAFLDGYYARQEEEELEKRRQRKAP